jgi:L-alanine-DL-glutamate epimerase-like enolase superfamily enzyme
VRDPWDIEGVLQENESLPPSALAALDSALHDLAASRLNVPVYRLLGLARPEPLSAYTLGIADTGSTLREAKKLSGFPILKMKVGDGGDLETVRRVSEASDARSMGRRERGLLPRGGAERGERAQGHGRRDDRAAVPASAGPEALRWGEPLAADPLPVIADESAITARDVPKLAGCASGVNVKLAKCGGIRGALRMIHTARAHGMLVMLGCMVETSLGIAAAAQLSGLVDFVDLDGAMLLADDPFDGLAYHSGRILLPERPGLGVEPVR